MLLPSSHWIEQKKVNWFNLKSKRKLYKKSAPRGNDKNSKGF